MQNHPATGAPLRTPNGKALPERFPFIRATCAYMGSYAYYLADEKARAEARGAPWDCTSANESDGGFRTMRDCVEGSPFWNHMMSNEPTLMAEFIKRRDNGTL